MSKEDTVVLSPSEKPAEKPAANSAKSEKKQNVAVWQFKFRFYEYLTPLKDERGGNRSIRVNNWKLSLNLDNKDDALFQEYLLSSDRNGLDFWPMRDRDGKEGAGDRADMLRRLMEQSVEQLQNTMTAEEWVRAGVQPNTTDKMRLIVAIMDTKLINKEGK